MKCKKCGQKAVIKLDQHHISYCKPHYIEWFLNTTERIITKYDMFTASDRILLAVSGGKDSLALWDVLYRLGYQVDGVYIQLGIAEEDYSKKSCEITQKFADERGLNLHVVNVVDETGKTIIDMAKSTKRGKGRPCSVCGLVKRHIMNRIAREHGYLILATGHNLDDEAAVLFGNTLQWNMDMLERQAPVLSEESGFARKVKPLCRFYERETTAYMLLNNFQYIYDECPYAEGSKSAIYKNLLNELEDKIPGTKTSFYLQFLKQKKLGHQFADQDAKPPFEAQCPVCGQPTITSDLCAYCRMKQLMQKFDD